MNLTQRHVEICRALHGRHTELARGDDDQRRHLTRMIAEQWCFEFGKDWGTKARSQTAPRSKDALAHRTGPSSMDIWDWQNGETREPNLHEGQSPNFPNVTDQFFIEVEPVNHLQVGTGGGTTDTPSGGGPLDTPSGGGPRATEQMLIEVLSKHHQEQLKELQAIRALLQQTGEAIQRLLTVEGPGGPR